MLKPHGSIHNDIVKLIWTLTKIGILFLIQAQSR